MRVIMMGTGAFAVPTFRALVASAHEVPALFTRPDRPLHGKSRSEANPMRAAATELGLAIHAPESINTSDARMVLASYRPDLLVVCDYGQILKPYTLEIARLGGINLHGSLLPKYRGAAPVQWAVYAGEPETGVTVIHMNAGVDAGAIIGRAVTPIGADETSEELEPRLAALGAPVVLAAVAALEQGTAQPIKQDAAQATKAPRLTKELGAVDWSRSAAQIFNQVRALKPWPKTHTLWPRDGQEPLRLILDRVRVEEAVESSDALVRVSSPGTVLEASGQRLVVATGEGCLAIEALQPAGKRVLTAGEFLRGYSLRAGERLAP
jgi:methionyl-tRNA formyltransferase